jgi:multiple sugar transport system ATP-binding protein
MGRAIVRRPAAFLMDEPLSNLDAKLRVQTRAEIAKLQDDLGTTTVYVTHDQIEAMTMGDRVAVMRKGRLQQVAPPQTLYDRPLNLFVGGFIGSPAMNLFDGKLQDGHIAIGEQSLELPAELAHLRPALQQYTGRDVIVGIRPEHLEDASLGGGPGRLKGEVRLVEALGSEVMAHMDIVARAPRTEETAELAADVGKEGPDAAHEHAPLVGRFDARSRVQAGQTAEVAVETAQLHFFDPETGLGIYDGGAT